MSPALAGGFLTTVPPGKSLHVLILVLLMAPFLGLFYLFSCFLSHISVTCSVSVDFWCPFNQPSILFGMRQGISK